MIPETLFYTIACVIKCYTLSVFQEAQTLPKIHLFGGSMLVRLGRYIASCQGYAVKKEKNRNGKEVFGYCTRGATIKQALRRLQKNVSMFRAVSVLLMLGTNDVLKGTRLQYMMRDVNMLLLELRRRKCIVKIILLPPIPRLQPGSNEEHIRKLYNNFLCYRAGALGMQVINSENIFTWRNGDVKAHLYEKYMGTRRDGIHWNREGMAAILEVLNSK